jgi:iron complex outermembrane receptor protein
MSMKTALRGSGSTITLAVSALIFGGAAAVAQTPAASSSSEEIVVTGTNIRGAAPVGSGLIQVGRQQIEKTGAQTVQQILRSVPAITSSGATPQGLNPGNSYFSPTIHGLGASSSNSTLVLIDGHRVAPGNQGALIDPNIIPPIALERVEVLAEGASSVYGSDAVAGVVNFITRRNYDGIQITGQTAFADSYQARSAGLLAGKRWDSGSAMFAYNYSGRDALKFADRDYLNRDHRAQGGTNFGSFFCAPASIQPGGAGNLYLGPDYTTNLANTAANSPCQKTVVGDVFPSDTRHNAMIKLRQDVSEKLNVGVDLVYSRLHQITNVSRGTLTTTVFRTGTQANPFYVNPAGILPGTTAGDRQSVRFNADDLLGPGAFTTLNTTDVNVSSDFEYKVNDRFRITGLALYGQNNTFIGSDGTLNVSAANLALNGTTNGSGSLTAPSIAGTSTIVTTLPLTAANTLDVWNPVATNRTSAAVKARLIDNAQTTFGDFSIQQYKLGADGKLATLPGGDLSLAVGGEYASYGFDFRRTRSNNSGPASQGSEFFGLRLGRHVESAFAELLVPLVGDNNAMSFIRKLDVSLSTRYDDYSEVGSTTNPRAAVNWEPVEGLTFRGNFARSFVAPQLVNVGDLKRGGLTTLSNISVVSQQLVVPQASFPLAASVPGVTCAAGTCTVSTSITGINVNGGAANAQPGKGESWSIGADFKPKFLSGFSAGITLFNNKLINQITGTSASNAINAAALNSNLKFFPAGATQADIDAVAPGYPLANSLPATISYILVVKSQNVLNLDIQGIDAQADYKIPTESMGTFNIGGSVTRFTKFDQFIKGGPKFSVLGTTGFNNTFPSIQTTGRGYLGWEGGGLAVTAYANYTSSFKNWSSSTVTPLVSASGNPVSGGDKVKANTVFDLNAVYSFGEGRLNGTQVFLDVANVFDKDPVFYNSANGIDPYSGNVLGRLVSVGFRLSY